jgi:dienelactone hydrolase
VRTQDRVRLVLRQRRYRVRLAVVAVLIVAGLLWRPVLYPAGKATVLLLDVYSPTLLGTNVAAAITPEPRVSETRETIAGIEMRVTWWRPGWGDRHPAILIVNGATPVGNDNVATRAFGTTLARAGYLVMLPEFPFLKEGRLDTDAPFVVDAAFARLRSLPETQGRRLGAFGASVGAGLMLVAAGTYSALGEADHLTILGGYFDMDTYVAAVGTRSTGDATWEPSAEASERLPPAVVAAMPNETDRTRVRRAVTAPSYAAALGELADLSAEGRFVVDRLSPSAVWSRVRPPVFWIHDPNDSYEPATEAYAAKAADREGEMTLVVPRLVQHAQVGATDEGPLFVLGELWSLLTFTLGVLRQAG